MIEGRIMPDLSEIFMISTVVCTNDNCKHNLINVKNQVGCNLKEIKIGKNGKCENFESIERIDK